jgi:FHA domain
MTVVCPSGHASATTDYCDQCGAPIASTAPPPQATAVLPVVEEADTSPAARRAPCPVCGAQRSGDDRYCEGCGHDFLAPPLPAAAIAEWEAVASADRAQFERFAVAGVSFPNGYLERRFALDEPELRIGRSRGRPGEEAAEIDLAGNPQDPGISRLHAVLERQADGTYAVRDLGSTNGTTVNDDPQPVGTDSPVPLADGDRIRLGAWTTITIRSRSAPRES